MAGSSQLPKPIRKYLDSYPAFCLPEDIKSSFVRTSPESFHYAARVIFESLPAGGSVWATDNLSLTPNFAKYWIEDGLEYLKINHDAACRGIDIHRIFIVSKDEYANFNPLLKLLATLHAKVGISSYIAVYEKLPIFSRYDFAIWNNLFVDEVIYDIRSNNIIDNYIHWSSKKVIQFNQKLSLIRNLVESDFVLSVQRESDFNDILKYADGVRSSLTSHRLLENHSFKDKEIPSRSNPVMETNKFLNQLIALNEELTQTSPFPWSNIDEWASRAIPTIRLGFPNFFSDFQRHLIPPQVAQLPRVGGNDAFNNQMALQEAETYKARANSAKRKLLNFLGSIIQTTSELKPSELDDFGILFRKEVFERDLKRLSAEAKHLADPLVLMMVDLDHFKQVNDTYGHPKGDEVLSRWFELIKQKVKGKGAAYRYGGDEVAILLPNYTTEEGVTLAELIRQSVEKSETGKEFGVTGSFGVACLPDNASDGTSLKEVADKALYKAKEGGRNRVMSASAMYNSDTLDGSKSSE